MIFLGFFKKLGDLGENFGWFLGGMFVFGLILVILRAQTRKFGEKEGKKVLKKCRILHFCTEKIQKYTDFGQK